MTNNQKNLTGLTTVEVKKLQEKFGNIFDINQCSLVFKLDQKFIVMEFYIMISMEWELLVTIFPKIRILCNKQLSIDTSKLK